MRGEPGEGRCHRIKATAQESCCKPNRFEAENAFGAELKHRYFCTFDARGEHVKKLVIEGPFGSKRII